MSADVIGVINTYTDAVRRNDPSALPLHPEVKFTSPLGYFMARNQLSMVLVINCFEFSNHNSPDMSDEQRLLAREATNKSGQHPPIGGVGGDEVGQGWRGPERRRNLIPGLPHEIRKE